MRKLEQEFKMEIIRLWKKSGIFKYIFCIETEETEPGFPDVLCVKKDGSTLYFEFKVTDTKGKIKFQRSQPRFYKTHKDLAIHLFVYDNSNDKNTFYDVPIKKVTPFLKTKLEVYLDEILDN